jgi:hypothetical protein
MARQFWPVAFLILTLVGVTGNGLAVPSHVPQDLDQSALVCVWTYDTAGDVQDAAFGFFVDDRTVLTTSHTLAGAYSALVMSVEDSALFPLVTVLKRDAETGIAAISVERHAGGARLALAPDSWTRPGVFAYVYGATAYQRGLINAVRQARGGGATYIDVAGLLGDPEGSPLLDEVGRVIGVVTSRASVDDAGETTLCRAATSATAAMLLSRPDAPVKLRWTGTKTRLAVARKWLSYWPLILPGIIALWIVYGLLRVLGELLVGRCRRKSIGKRTQAYDAEVAELAEMIKSKTSELHLYSRIVDTSPGTVHDGALAEVEQIVAKDPSKARGYLLRGLCSASRWATIKGQAPEVRDSLLAKMNSDYREAIAKDPSDDNLRLHRLEGMILTRDWRGALAFGAELGNQLKGPREQFLWSWLMNIASALSGRIPSAEAGPASDGVYVGDRGSEWRPARVEALLEQLEIEGFGPAEVRAARAVHSSVLKQQKRVRSGDSQVRGAQ